MRHYIFLLLLPVLSCEPSGPTAIQEVITITGNVRYQEDNRSFKADIVFPDSTERAPTFLGSIMEPVRSVPTRRFRTQREIEFPEKLRFSIPMETDYLEFSYDLMAPSADSIPDTLNRTQVATFPVAQAGMKENESLVIFFEPADRSTPKRILVTGPTALGVVTLPTSAIDDVPPGNYEVYLIKQQLFRKQQENIRVSVQTEYFTVTRPLVVE